MKLLKWLAIGFGVLILGFIGLVIIGLTLGDSAGKRANPDGNRELATPATAPAGAIRIASIMRKMGTPPKFP